MWEGKKSAREYTKKPKIKEGWGKIGPTGDGGKDTTRGRIKKRPQGGKIKSGSCVAAVPPTSRGSVRGLKATGGAPSLSKRPGGRKRIIQRKKRKERDVNDLG